MVNSVLHINLQQDPWEALLHKPIEGTTKRERTLASHIFPATKQTIAKVWTTPIGNFDKVKNQVHGTLVNEKLTVILTDTHDKSLHIWQPWLDYFPSVQLRIHKQQKGSLQL